MGSDKNQPIQHRSYFKKQVWPISNLKWMGELLVYPSNSFYQNEKIPKPDIYSWFCWIQLYKIANFVLFFYSISKSKLSQCWYLMSSRVIYHIEQSWPWIDPLLQQHCSPLELVQHSPLSFVTYPGPCFGPRMQASRTK